MHAGKKLSNNVIFEIDAYILNQKKNLNTHKNYIEKFKDRSIEIML